MLVQPDHLSGFYLPHVASSSDPAQVHPHLCLHLEHFSSAFLAGDQPHQPSEASSRPYCRSPGASHLPVPGSSLVPAEHLPGLVRFQTQGVICASCSPTPTAPRAMLSLRGALDVGVMVMMMAMMMTL